MEIKKQIVIVSSICLLLSSLVAKDIDIEAEIKKSVKTNSHLALTPVVIHDEDGVYISANVFSPKKNHSYNISYIIDFETFHPIVTDWFKHDSIKLYADKKHIYAYSRNEHHENGIYHYSNIFYILAYTGNYIYHKNFYIEIEDKIYYGDKLVYSKKRGDKIKTDFLFDRNSNIYIVNGRKVTKGIPRELSVLFVNDNLIFVEDKLYMKNKKLVDMNSTIDILFRDFQSHSIKK